MILRSRPDMDDRHWFSLMAQPSVSAGARALLEAEGRQRFGAGHYLATHRGTTALDLLFHHLPLQPGDEVVMSAITYVGVANSVLRAGGTPVLVDVAPGRLMAGARELATGISHRTRAVIATHLFGVPCAAPAIRELADRHRLLCVEDCAHALGVTIHHQPVGSFGHASVFSFGFEKHLTTGRGGALLINDARAFATEPRLPACTREMDLEMLLGAWLEFKGSDPAHCKRPFRLDRAGHEALQDHPRLRRLLMDAAARGHRPNDRLLRACWKTILARRHLVDAWRRPKAGRRSVPERTSEAPPSFALGDLRAAIGRHEMTRLPDACRHRRRVSDQLATCLRDWPGGHVAPDITQEGAQPLHLPLLFADPARAALVTDRALTQGIVIGPSPWGIPLQHYPLLAGRVRLATPSLPASEQAMQRLRLVPLHAGVNDEVLARIVSLIRSVT
jgi:dTDP-4-amino-4,6-dideoxygalactose transaminase